MHIRCAEFAAAAAAVIAMSGAAGFAGQAFGQEGGRPLTASLSGPAEKPTAGDPDGAGSAKLKVNVGQAQVCYDLEVSGIAVATMAHIHKAPPTAAGPVTIALKPPAANGKVSGCASAARDVVKDILQNPGAYYVNVHNAQYPAGAVRGQLSK
jgi:hypothetical protein